MGLIHSVLTCWVVVGDQGRNARLVGVVEVADVFLGTFLDPTLHVDASSVQRILNTSAQTLQKTVHSFILVCLLSAAIVLDRRDIVESLLKLPFNRSMPILLFLLLLCEMILLFHMAVVSVVEIGRDVGFLVAEEVLRVLFFDGVVLSVHLRSHLEVLLEGSFLLVVGVG
jgi:hypothetical protein